MSAEALIRDYRTAFDAWAATQPRTTGRRMCEEVAAWLATKGVSIDPEDLWNADPAGGLVHVFALHQRMRVEQGT